MIYALSDIHGYIDLLKERFGYILPRLQNDAEDVDQSFDRKSA